MHSRFFLVRSLTVNTRHVLMALLLLLLLLLLLVLLVLILGYAVLLSCLLLPHAIDSQSLMLYGITESMMRQEEDKKEKYLKENLAVMATSLAKCRCNCCG